MCSYWLRTWRPHMYTPFAYAITKTPYAFLAKIIICMYLLYDTTDEHVHLSLFLSNEVDPFFASFSCYRHVFIPERYLVYRDIIAGICGVRTPISNTSFRHISTKTLNDCCILLYKSLFVDENGFLISRPFGDLLEVQL